MTPWRHASLLLSCVGLGALSALGCTTSSALPVDLSPGDATVEGAPGDASVDGASGDVSVVGDERDATASGNDADSGVAVGSEAPDAEAAALDSSREGPSDAADSTSEANRTGNDAADANGTANDGADAPGPLAPYARPNYQHLAETGLFDDFAARHVAPTVTPFEPTYKLWSDGATKRRWVELPPGTQIDTSDMDHWVFPIGTKFFKEFSLGGVLLETRLVERYGTGSEDYWMGAFVWTADQTDAVLAVDGQKDINGTMHDAPAQKDCGACHRGDVGRILGFSAIQLSRTGNGPTLRDLASAGLLASPPEGGADFPLLGDATTVTALGYLHANCGHCHNENGTAWPDTQMVLRLTVADRDLTTSGVVKSIVGKNLQYWRGGAITVRVAPGAPDMSAIVARMSARGTKDQMPPLATEIIDPDGIAAVRAWIAALPP